MDLNWIVLLALLPLLLFGKLKVRTAGILSALIAAASAVMLTVSLVAKYEQYTTTLNSAPFHIYALGVIIPYSIVILTGIILSVVFFQKSKQE